MYEKIIQIIREVYKKRDKRIDYELALLGFPLSKCSKEVTKKTASKWFSPATLEKIYSSIGINLDSDDFTDEEISNAYDFAKRIIRNVYPDFIPLDAYSLFDEEIKTPFGKVIKKFEPPKPKPTTFISFFDAFKSFPNWSLQKFCDWIRGIQLPCFQTKENKPQFFLGYDDFCNAVNDWRVVQNDELNADSCVALSDYATCSKVFKKFAPNMPIYIDDDDVIFPAVDARAEFNRVLDIADFTRRLINDNY